MHAWTLCTLQGSRIQSASVDEDSSVAELQVISILIEQKEKSITATRQEVGATDSDRSHSPQFDMFDTRAGFADWSHASGGPDQILVMGGRQSTAI